MYETNEIEGLQSCFRVTNTTKNVLLHAVHKNPSQHCPSQQNVSSPHLQKENEYAKNLKTSEKLFANNLLKWHQVVFSNIVPEGTGSH